MPQRLHLTMQYALQPIHYKPMFRSNKQTGFKKKKGGGGGEEWGGGGGKEKVQYNAHKQAKKGLTH